MKKLFTSIGIATAIINVIGWWCTATVGSVALLLYFAVYSPNILGAFGSMLVLFCLLGIGVGTWVWVYDD